MSSTLLQSAPSAPTRAVANPLPLLDQLLEEQRDLTAVERFAQLHDAAELSEQTQFYSALLPSRPLQTGEQLAFEVDLDRCSGCKACVAACHALNGLDDQETWRDVGLLIGGSEELPVLQHVTTACHHCLDPACLNGCPTRAYEKDPVTGIVKHLDDQCFGCQYCILACPYGVPKYNKSKGIVRKCDMCSQRLEVGEAPACVQACPHSAIRITTVRKDDVVANSETHQFLPGAPDPQYTLPTTNYKRREVFPRNTIPADYFSVHAEHAHPPLIVMLVLTQLSVGVFLVEQFSQRLGLASALGDIRPVQCALGLICGLVALGASTLHLGRPHLAFRAVLGLRYSWLSREILAFGAFAPLAALYAGASWMTAGHGSNSPKWLALCGAAVALAGLAGIVCSIKIYQCTRRPFWNGTTTSLKFLLTSAWLGTATTLCAALLGAHWIHSGTSAGFQQYITGLCRALVVIAGAKLLVELMLLFRLCDRVHTPLRRSALLLAGKLSKVFAARLVCGGFGGLLMPSCLLLELDRGDGLSMAAGWIGSCLLVASLAGELLERYLFFTAAVAPRMPGDLRT